MDSSESDRAKTENHQAVVTVEKQQDLDTTPTKQSDSDYTYEDDFEELDSSVQDKSQDLTSSPSASENSGRQNGVADSDTTTTETSEKDADKNGSVEEDATDSSQKRQSPSAFDDPQSDDSEPEPEGDVLFTDDQQRAMMELMAQKYDSGDYSDDPPEYNVKDRLKELNAELAMEPDPDDRQHRVGFKEELVDLVAPPPEVSDEEETPRKPPTDDGDNNQREQGGGEKKKQFVVERDGKFDVVADNELTASERAMFNIPDQGNQSETKAGDSQIQNGGGDNQASSGKSSPQGDKENVRPTPPSKPRPNTASGLSRRNVRPSQSPRPQTASSTRYSKSTGLQDFSYNSPYAMSSQDKERAQERARMKEQQKKDDEKRRKEEEEYLRKESEEAFQAWLKRKREDDRRRRQEEEDGKKKNAKEDREAEAKESEEAFKGWLKTKQVQIRREKLLKKREEQEIKDGYYVRSREECDQAYKEWLKKKYSEIRRQRAVEKQRARSYRSYAKRSRKQQMMARAVRQSQAFRYVDYYGYRF